MKSQYIQTWRVELEERTETMLYRILQESLANVIRHATATTVHVTLRAIGRTVELRVRDDGIGFVTAAPGSFARDGHYGNAGMRGRAVLADGTLEVESIPGRGTSVITRVPVTSLSASRLATSAARTPRRVPSLAPGTTAVTQSHATHVTQS